MSDSPHRLLATAIAGRVVPVVAVPERLSWSDGDTIFLAQGDGPRTVVIQAALLTAGALDPWVLARTIGNPRLRRRYLVLEVLRAVHGLKDVVPRGPQRCVLEIYDAEPARSPSDSLRRARARGAVPAAPDWFGTLKPGEVIRRSGLGPARQEREPSSDLVPDPAAEAESGRSTSSDDPSVLFRNPLSRLMQNLLGGDRTPEPNADGGREVLTQGARTGRTGPEAAQHGLQDELEELARSFLHAGHSYPEWDYRRRRYRPDHCVVGESDPADSTPAADVEDDHDDRLRRELARLGLAHERHRHERDGDDLDLTALSEYAVERARGAVADDRVYELRRRTAHDLGVIVLLDATGSTNDSEHEQRVFDDQRRVAARLITVFDELGDRVAAYGFQSWGRHAVRFLRVKDFDERWDVSGRRRLAAMTPGGFTRLGAAVRHGTRVAAQRSGTRSKLMIVVGDGLPYDDGYEGRYAQEDSAKAFSEAVTAGIGCTCLSVRVSTSPEILARVWGHVPSIHLGHVGDLHHRAEPVFRRALNEAAVLGRDGREWR